MTNWDPERELEALLDALSAELLAGPNTPWLSDAQALLVAEQVRRIAAAADMDAMVPNEPSGLGGLADTRVIWPQ